MRCPRCDHPLEPSSDTCVHCSGGAPEQLPTRASKGRAAASPHRARDDDSGPTRGRPQARGQRGPVPDRRRWPRSRFEPGDRLGGRYRIIALVGCGGMGEIYKADDLKLGQTVALKFLPPELERDPAVLERLLGEVRLARQVAHPNACRVFDVGEVDGRHFITMEFVDGEDLSSLLRRIGRLSEDKAIQVARQICAGLAAAHDQGIIHRDLKPANVMLDGRGHAKITDFGLAAVAKDIADEDLGSGTPAYMAPEQHEKREITTRTDIYSLGLVLFELFTGRRAVDADRLDAALRSGSAPTPSQPSEVATQLDPDVDAIIQRCLEVDPARRPPSALAVAAALPGSDALAAALAAGDTPSPEMVADAGQQASFAPKAAVATLAALLALLLVQPWLSDRATPPSFPDRPKAPAVLADRAAELAARLGLDDGSRTTRHWYSWLGSGREAATGPSPLFFGWRKAPAGTMPRAPNNSSWVDPPMEVPGNARMLMDDQGLVVSLLATPPNPEAVTPPREPGPDGLDWPAVLDDLGYGDFDLRPVEPAAKPPIFADDRRAFEGTWPDTPDLRVRVEAAASEGTLVWLDATIGDRRPSDAMVAGWTGAGARKLSLTRLLMFLLLPALAGAFAWRNHRLRRADFRGARLALAAVFVGGTIFALCKDPFYNSAREWNTLIDGFKSGLLMGVEAWLFYLGLEPYVRRYWPNVLIGWTRLAASRRKDPLVGEEILAGCALGALGACMRAGAPLLDDLLQLPGDLAPRLLATFPGEGGLRDALGGACLGVQSGFVWGLMVLFVATVARLLVGRAWPLVAGALFAVLVVTLEAGMGRGGVVALLEAACRSTIVVLALSRRGLLACITAVGTYSAITSVQPTLNADLWFFGPRIALLPIIAIIGAWAFTTSLGGRRLLPDAPAR